MLALSSPMKAQKMISSDAGTVCSSGSPVTFHDAAKTVTEKCDSPRTMARNTGSKPMIKVIPLMRVTTRAPNRAARVSNQIKASVAARVPVGVCSAGIREPR